jgi:L-alanine-DL-glutamate epimerase-like enolase superfamily enzyme
MAAVDIALWDILGRRAGRPVHALLGTKRRDRVRAYATHPLGRDFEETADHARRLVAQGFTAVKFGWRPFGENSRQDEKIVRTIREAIGPEVDLLIDCGNAFDVDQALDRIERLKEYDLYWLEEPLDPNDIDGYARLAKARPAMRIAAGELCSTIEELRLLLEQGHLQVIQVDISRVGITRALEFARFAETRGVRCVNHTYTLDIALAASLHLAAVLEEPLLFEYPAAPNDLRQVFSRRPAQVGGFVAIPEGPGLGIDVDEGALAAVLAG